MYSSSQFTVAAQNKQQHHTCMAQNTALTSDTVSSLPTITPAPTAPAASTTATTTTIVQCKWGRIYQKLLSQKHKCPCWPWTQFCYNPQKPALWGVHHCGGTSMFEPGATQCRRAEGRNKGSFETCA